MLSKMLAEMNGVGEGEERVFITFVVSSPEGPMVAQQCVGSQEPAKHIIVKSRGHQEGGRGWGQWECTNFVNCTVPSRTRPWVVVREQREGKGKQTISWE